MTTTTEPSLLVIDRDAAVRRFMDLTGIPGRSGQEADVAAAISKILLDAGVDAAGIVHDGGAIEMIRHGAIGGERIQATISGFASHAGVAPEKGVSAIVIASRAIAALDDAGLHGLIRRDGKRGTVNVGVFQGGEATNVVTPEVQLKIEARSHDPEFRTWIVSQIRAALEQAAREVTDISGRCGQIQWSSHVDYEAFALELDHPSVEAARRWISKLGHEPICELANGGLDTNWLFQHGIQAVTLGCGQAAIHTPEEYLMLDHYLDACRLAASILVAPQSPQH